MPVFTPRSEEELYPLIPHDLVCNFEVINAEEKPSKVGNPMIVLHLKVWDMQGAEYTIKDHLIFTDKMLYKIKHFCESVGLAEKYCSGQLTELDCNQRAGKAKVIVTTDPSGQYRPKNEIKDYIPNLGNVKPDFDDDIPM